MCELHMIYDESYGIVFNLKSIQNVHRRYMFINSRALFLIIRPLWSVHFYLNASKWKEKNAIAWLDFKISACKFKLIIRMYVTKSHENENDFSKE